MQANSNPVPLDFRLDPEAFCQGYCRIPPLVGRPKGGGYILAGEEKAKLCHYLDHYGSAIAKVRCTKCRDAIKRRFYRVIATLQRDFRARQLCLF